MTTYLLEVSIKGMYSDACIHKLEYILTRAGASDVEIDIAEHTARVEFEDSRELAEHLVAMIEKAGYRVADYSVTSKS